MQRHFARLGLNTRPDGSPPEAFGRFEAAAPGDLWTGDALHGPTIAGRKTYLFAFIDDHSRALVGYRWGLSEDTVRLEAALRSALAARGVPDAAATSTTARRTSPSSCCGRAPASACASCTVDPGRPEGRGKIERVFETVRIQFLVEIEARPPADLAGLNRLFTAWVETVYHRRRHTETGEAPIDRLLAAGPPTLPTPAALHEAFLWSETRTVTKTATISLHGNAFEVDAALVGSTCRGRLRPLRHGDRRDPLPGPVHGRTASQCRSAATPTPRPAPSRRLHPRRPASTTSASSPSAATPNSPSRSSTTPSSRSPTSSHPPPDDTTTTAPRSSDDHRPPPRPLGPDPHALRQRPRPLHAPHPPQPRRSRGPHLLVRAGTGHRPHHRRGRRRQDRRRARRPRRARHQPQHRHLPRQPLRRDPRPLRHDRHRPRRHTTLSPRLAHPPSRRSPSPPKKTNEAGESSSSWTRPTCSTPSSSKASAC